VEPVVPLLPELHDLRSKVIATPAFRALDVVSVKPFQLNRELVD
jgi:hypothetical protein